MRFSPMVLFFSMLDYRMSFPPIQLQDHPTKALGKGMGQTIQSIDPLCEEVLSIFDLWGQSQVFFDNIVALLFLAFSHIRTHVNNRDNPVFFSQIQACVLFACISSHAPFIH